MKILLSFVCILGWQAGYPVTSLKPDKNNIFSADSLLPVSGEVENWFPEGEVRVAEGRDLYLLIDGGAEIFHEYGFKKATFQTYGSTTGQSVNVELYEMNDSQAAYGMYTFKTGQEGTPLDIGQDGWQESYFLNFWRGNYLITVIGLNDDSQTLAGITKLARKIDARLNAKSVYPSLISCLPGENLVSNGITYLRGNLALFNYYFFDTRDIFGLREGVAGKYPGYSLVIFQYRDRDESEANYLNAKNHLKSSDRFTDFNDSDTSIEMRDLNNRRIFITRFRKWLVIVIAEKKVDSTRLLESVKLKLPTS